MDDFASDEEQMQKLRQLAQSLEKSIFTDTRAMPSVKLNAFSPVVETTGSPLRGRDPEPAKLPVSRDSSIVKQAPMMLIQDLEEENIYDRLYNMSKKKPTPKPVEEKPMPQKVKRKPTEWDLNVKDKRRDLYIDAECRRRVLQEKILEQEKQAEEQSRRVITAPASKVMAKRRKVRELKELFARYSTRSTDTSVLYEDRQCGKMSYAALKSALFDLGFVSSKGTEDDEKLTDNAWCAMHQVQAPYSPPSVYIHFPGFAKVVFGMLDKSDSRSRSPSVGSGRRAQSSEAARRPRSVSPAASDAVQLQGNKRQNAISRQLAEPSTVKRQYGNPDEDRCTFNPAINDNSRRLLRTRSNGPGYVRLSSNSTTRRERKLEKSRKEKLQYEQKECTFQPTINRMQPGRVRDEQSFMNPTHRRQREVEPPASKEEIALQECTFEPKVNPYRRIRDQPLPNGYFESIKRLRESRSDNRTFEDKLREPASMGGYSQKHVMKTTTVKPFNFKLERKQGREKPLMYLDIQLPKGKKGRIGIHQNDTAVGLAKSFASTYQLDGGMETKLLKVLEHHIETLVPKLVERRQSGRKRESIDEGAKLSAQFAESAAKIEKYADEGHGEDSLTYAEDAGLELNGEDLRDMQQWSDDDDNADLKAVLGDDLKVSLGPDLSFSHSPRETYTHDFIESLAQPNTPQDGIEALFEEIRQMEEQYGITSK
eukprot:TRINITY_DN36928_c0_g1_i1.p1 TRINITY_DN36928_c0_g1~~TRINITY_DN36928_c0_g1_i1.p1  ORF type:complete len:708 (+),score=168.94 TRINITY_DN36928_c0_g1_i1:31-2154(+)